MDIKTLSRLQKLNQLNLTETEENELMEFFAKAEKDAEILATVDTENVERMVYVMPMTNVIREDKRVQNFDRKDLLAGAPQGTDDSWQVPRLVK